MQEAGTVLLSWEGGVYVAVLRSSVLEDLMEEVQADVIKHESPGSVFFFQAEDGIRDLTVTGVQTCALPIWSRSDVAPALEECRAMDGVCRGRAPPLRGGRLDLTQAREEVRCDGYDRVADVPRRVGRRGPENRHVAARAARGPVRLSARRGRPLAGRARLAPGRGGRVRELGHRARQVRAGRQGTRPRAAPVDRGARPGLRTGARRRGGTRAAP